MLVSLNWLQTFVPLTLPPAELAQTLTIAGFEVEGIEDRRTWADGVVVGYVQTKEPHPDATKLSVCTVDVGQGEPATIVCGASNVRAGISVPVALPKTYLPAINLKLKKTKLRGVKSEGMICSLAELGLAKESAGIHIFEGEFTPGQDVRPLLGLDDVVLDVTSTANRADALSMVGIAREVAALTDQVVTLPDIPPQASPSSPALTVKLADGEACPVYFGTAIEGVKIAPSPDWLQFRLQAAGVRPINNVVDITNYILLEWGQPLHAFDGDRLHTVTGSSALEIGVRLAQPGETLKTLDGQERTLAAQNLLITANEHPVALAGVMGGEATEVHSGTVKLMLEAALFEPVAIRRSARAQGLRTEASTRYERGVNPAELEQAMHRAIALILELAGGEITAQSCQDHRPANLERSLTLRLSRLQQILGPVKTGQITAADVERILSSLGCQLATTAPEVWSVTIPPYRHRDLEREIDLIEEVARLYGYDHFCDTLPNKTQPGIVPFATQTRQRIRTLFRAVGLTELVHYSLVKPEQAQISLANPLLSEYSALRDELITGLIDAFVYNQAQGNGALNGFEWGRIFFKDGEQLRETDAIAGIMGGDRDPGGRWTTGGKGEPLTWYEAKGKLEAVFQSLGLTVSYEPTDGDRRLHPGRTAALSLGDQPLGIFVQVHPQLRRDRDLPEAVYQFQLQADVLLGAIAAQGTADFRNFSPYPAVERDLAFFAPTEISVAALTATMTQAGKKLLRGVELFDEYRGQNVPTGQRSLAFSLAYRAGDRTLTDTDVEPIHQSIRDALVAQFNVTLRS
ncbi:MAG: phenylalanine--tRNA ligase subunit beta [Spirulina sp. DLM2.Bin59]|nr:MAG: phenylalanine--tRNA ligase subunit beta [Spirulina sp. DLM2.Bin59]